MAEIRWKPKSGTSWQDKLKQEHPNHGKVVPASPSQKKRGITSLLIPRPLDVDSVVRGVPKGRVITMTQLRKKLAEASEADEACPMTTGIFLRIVAEAAEEARAAGRKRITPYWRVVDAKGGLRDRFPGGIETQAERLRAEGIAIGPAKGKQPPRVQDLERVSVT